MAWVGSAVDWAESALRAPLGQGGRGAIIVGKRVVVLDGCRDPATKFPVAGPFGNDRDGGVAKTPHGGMKRKPNPAEVRKKISVQEVRISKKLGQDAGGFSLSIVLPIS